MNWKTSIIIFSEVTVETDTYYFEDYRIQIDQLPGFMGLDNNSQIKLLTILFNHSNIPVEEVYFKSIDIANKFLGRISLLGYCATEIVKHVITTVETIDVDIPFDVLTTDILHTREFRYKIDKHSFDKVKKLEEEYLEVALSFLWKALSSDSLEEKIVMLSACLEKLGSVECKECTKIKCRICENEELTNIKATKKYLKELLISKGATHKQASTFLDEVRNKVVHGGGARGVAFYSNLKKSILNVQHLIVEIISNRFKTGLVNSTTSIIDLPFAIYKFKRQSNNVFMKGEASFASQAAISKVKNMDEKSYQNISVKVGILDAQINLLLDLEFQKVFFPKVIAS